MHELSVLWYRDVATASCFLLLLVMLMAVALVEKRGIGLDWTGPDRAGMEWNRLYVGSTGGVLVLLSLSTGTDLTRGHVHTWTLGTYMVVVLSSAVNPINLGRDSKTWPRTTLVQTGVHPVPYANLGPTY